MNNNEIFGRITAPEEFEKAVIVHVEFSNKLQDASLEELQELSYSAGARSVHVAKFNNTSIEAKYFVGSGQLEQINQAAKSAEADVVIFNHNLSPSQERNISKQLNRKVIDRVRLILDIFALRARTYEGKLQVELAQLKHMSTRLTGGWTHLERQKGGIGLRGPGETQLESDRRIIQQRMKSIRQRLLKVRKQRSLGRNARTRNDLPTIVMVGYTNAGKSTLFNQLTSAGVYQADQLFATLDTTLRRIQIAGIGACVLADTVGFIRHLPHELVDAFRATLEEVTEADLLLHVIDSSDEQYDEKMSAVNVLLESIDADKIPVVEVFNKNDLIQSRPESNQKCDIYRQVYVSALESSGMNELLKCIGNVLRGERCRVLIDLHGDYGKLRSQLYSFGEVISESCLDDGAVQMEMRISHQEKNRLKQFSPAVMTFKEMEN